MTFKDLTFFSKTTFYSTIILFYLSCESITTDQSKAESDDGDIDNIYESITITYPIGGESLDPGMTIPITWESTIDACEWGVNIVLLRNGQDESNIAINTPNDGSFDWYINGELESANDYQIRIDGLCYNGNYCIGCIYSQSQETFTISQNVIEPYITLLSPNGGENIEIGGDSLRVLWETNLPDCFFGFKISLYQVEEQKAILATSVKNDGDQNVFISNSWNLENGNNYKIYLESLCENSTTYCGGCYGDYSDETFQLYSNQLKVINPNGGEEWTRGETKTITWTNDSTTQNIRIELYKDGSRLQDIEYNLENNYSFDWILQNTLIPDDDYQIKITSWETNVSDFSDNNFAIE